jgi:hypothetical protein
LRKESFAGAGELADGVPKRSAAVVSATAGLAGVDGLAIGGACFVCAGREAIADQLTKKDAVSGLLCWRWCPTSSSSQERQQA